MVAESRLGASVRALRHRNFALFFVGMLVSMIGSNMQSVAQGWLVGTLVGWDQAVVYIGLVGIVSTLPIMILSLFGGVLADVMPKRPTLLATQAASGALALVLAALTALDLVQVWHVFVLAFLLGTINALDMPTRQSFFMEMVGREDIANAVAMNSALMNGARILGPAAAGLLIGWLGTPLCFLVNGLSFGAVIVSLLAMRTSELMPAARLPRPRSVGEVGSNLGEGLRYAWRTPIIRLVLVTVGMVSIFGLNFFNIILPVVAASTLKSGASGYGFLTSALGLGALVSAMFVATSRRPRLRVLIGGGMLLAVGDLALAFTTSFPVALAASFCAGMGLIGSASIGNSLIQITVPGALRGRVMSLWTLVVVGSSPIGNVITGGVGGLLGIPAAIVVAAAVIFGANAMAVGAAMRGFVRGGAGGTRE
jgi:MFS family permease